MSKFPDQPSAPQQLQADNRLKTVKYRADEIHENMNLLLTTSQQTGSFYFSFPEI